MLDFIDRIPDFIFPNLEKKSFTLYVIWREVCHIVGSFVLLSAAHFLFLATTFYFPLYVMVVLGAWMLYQEFYLHPKKYNQQLWKGILDFSSWLVPFVIYLLV